MNSCYMKALKKEKGRGKPKTYDDLVRRLRSGSNAGEIMGRCDVRRNDARTMALGHVPLREIQAIFKSEEGRRGYD